MKIRSDQLADQLKKKPPAFACLYGEEPLLLDKAVQQLKHYAKQQGFNEQINFHLDTSAAWKQLQTDYYEQSLFSEQVLCICYLNSGKPGVEGSKILKQFMLNPNPDKQLILVCQKLESATLQSAWMKQFIKSGLVVQAARVSNHQFPGWLTNRIKQLGYTVNPEAKALLCERLEGNLLAAEQALTRLGLQADSTKTMTAEMVDADTSMNRQTNLYTFSDHVLAGDLDKIYQSLAQLKREAVEPILILWILTKLCRELAQLGAHRRAKKSLSQLFDELRIWSSKQALYQRALKRQPTAYWRHCLFQAYEFDKALKGQLPNRDIWQALLGFALQMGGQTTCQTATSL